MNAFRRWMEGLAWLPIPVFWTALLTLKLSGSQAVFESPLLLLLLNFAFTTLTSAVVVILIARSFLSRAKPGLLFFGCGVLFWGAAGTVAPALLSRDGNAAVSIHNILVWLSGLCHLAGVALSMKPARTIRRAELTLALAYASALGAVWLVTLLVLNNWTPVFFVQDQGGTPMRQFVLGSAVTMFAGTAVLLRWSNRSAPSRFVRWYGLSMLLAATGLFGVMIDTAHGSLLCWAGRMAQLLGGAYMLAAAFASVRESGAWTLDLAAELSRARESAQRSEERSRILAETLSRSEQFAHAQQAEAGAALEAVPAHIAILDADGVIIRVNKAWRTFASQNGLTPGAVSAGANYLAVCDRVDGAEAAQARSFADGIRGVIRGEREFFSMEYPCHSREELRWFMGYVTAPPGGGPARAVVAHVNITAQKQVEEEIRLLNQGLESRVVERTSELQTAVNALETEIAERQRLEHEILKISEHEQSRIGRDLHDGACQNLACIAVLAEFAARELDREKSRTADKAREIAGIARQSMDEVRRLAAGLFPVKIEQQGLEAALRQLAEETSARNQVQCRFVAGGSIVFHDINAAVQLYRIAQEAVANAVRHGRARNIAIELDECGGTVTLAVYNDGDALPAEAKKSGLGLHTMQYRARMLGGTLAIGPSDALGTAVICSFPGKEFIHAKKNTAG